MLQTTSLPDTGTLGAAAREQARVRDHLVGAEHSARWQPARLEPLTALCRALLLDELSRYRRRGRFPRNVARGTKPVAQFIDERGTRCAVAHLMEISGQGELVRHIAQTDNNARVQALARLPELRAWLDAAGLSLDEAARIQPTYCYYEQADACFCESATLTGVALGTVVGQNAGSVLARVDRIEGDVPGLSVGDLRDIALNRDPALALGRQLFIGYSGESAGGTSTLQLVGSLLSIDDGAVTCAYDNQTAQRPVSVETAIDAFLAGRDCVGVLASDDSAWNERYCDGDSAGEESGCAVTVVDGNALVGAELTTAALLVALLLHRRRRR
jgi:MYXO-CTERM domain-containing protein